MKLRVDIRNRVDALTPTLSVIIVLLVVTSTVGSVVFWGVPYVETLDSKKDQENTEMQFNALADAINDVVINSKPGDKTGTAIDPGDGGSISVDQEGDRVIIMYSYDAAYDFTVHKLGLDDNPKYFEIDLPDGLSNDLCSKAVISWIEFDETCFLSGTKVLTADGLYKNIEAVEAGDMVKSYCEQTGEILVSRVTRVFQHAPKEMADYYLVINNQLCVTPNHRFFSDGKWVFAGNLRFGDLLFCGDWGEVYSIYSLERVYDKVSTFDLEVEPYHTYFVSMVDDGVDVLVHNDLGPGSNIPPNPPTNIEPADGATGVSINPVLIVSVSDPNGDTMSVEFYGGNSITMPQHLGTVNGVSSGTNAEFIWSGTDYDITYDWYAIANDGEFSRQSLTWSFTTAPNLPPDKPTDPIPENKSTGIGINPELSVYVSDPNGGSIDVEFFGKVDGSSFVKIGTDLDVDSGGRAVIIWSGREYYTNYYWYAVASDGNSQNQSDIWNFTTGPMPNIKPNKPTDPSPENGAVDVGLSPTLSVKVSDPNGDDMTVYFYDAIKYSLIGAPVGGVKSGDFASVVWDEVDYGTLYKWYAVAYDGEYYSEPSPTWSFTTIGESSETETRNGEDPFTISTDKSLEGTVVVKLYNADDSMYGKIFMFDSNSITNGDIVLENGGVVYSSSENSYVKNSPRIYEENGVFSFSVVQMVKSSSSNVYDVSGPDTYRLVTKFKGGAMQRDEAKGDLVYGLKIQFYGDHKDTWSEYLNETYSFELKEEDGEPDILIYQSSSVRLMLWHSFITFSIEK